MNREKTTYYKYKNTSGRITISDAIAGALNWNHLDKLTVKIETINGNIGIFIIKDEKVDK